MLLGGVAAQALRSPYRTSFAATLWEIWQRCGNIQQNNSGHLLNFSAVLRLPYRKECPVIKSSPPALGTSVKNKPGQWVQTERKAHEAWAQLISRKPRAAEVLHYLVAHMGSQNAVVIPQKVLATLMGRSVDTVQRAIRDLAAERWIQVVRIGRGKEAAYVINEQVAWGQSRDQLRLSAFSATVVSDAGDQDDLTLDQAPLRRLPTLYPGEQQLPSGEGLAPPSQPHFVGMEPNLPARSGDAEQLDIEDFTREREE